MNKKLLALACAFVAMGTNSALAHVTLEKTKSPSGVSYKAIFRVGHGCEGSPTTSLRITMPEGYLAAKPMPKPGWTIETSKGRYATTHDLYGKPVTEGTREIAFKGSLSDDHYDEFVINGIFSKSIPDDAKLYFPVVQECEKGDHRWVEIPSAGQDRAALKSPAPFVTIAALDVPPATIRAGDLVVSHPWLREPPPAARAAGAYLTIDNTGSVPDRLLAVEGAAAAKLELHEMTNASGVMTMRALEAGLELPPGKSVELKPGGYHMMLMGLKDALKAGRRVPLTLVFEKAGRVTVDFEVVPLGGASSAAQKTEEHKH